MEPIAAPAGTGEQGRPAPILPPMSPPQPSWKQDFKHEGAPPASEPSASVPETIVPPADAPEKKEE